MRRIIYIHEQKDWYDFKWDRDRTGLILSKIRYEQGRIRGRTENLNPGMRKEALLNALTAECLASAAIEGDVFAEAEVRSAVARCLNIRYPGMIPGSSAVQGLAGLICDAALKPERKIGIELLQAWHKKLFAVTPAGEWRKEPLSLSYEKGTEILKYECAPHNELKPLMQAFAGWLQTTATDPLIASGVAHLWFLSIHPFMDGNGVLARALSQFLMGRSENGAAIYYSVSKKLQQQKTAYFLELNTAQRGGNDITSWLEWYLEQVLEAVKDYRELQKEVVHAQNLEQQIARKDIKPRQKRIIQRMGEMGQSSFTSSQWAKMAGISQDSAIRDIRQLLNSGLLQKMRAGGRSTKYRIMR
jgi:Fic family protein